MADIEIDWDEILRLYAEGVQTGRELARIVGCTEGTIRARARKAGIKQPAQRSKRVLNKVQDAVDRATAGAGAVTARDVEAALVQVGRDVVLEHRVTIKAGMAVVKGLLDDLQRVTSARETIERAVWALIDSSGVERDTPNVAVLIEALAAAVDLSGKSKAAQALANALKSLIGLERQAFGLASKVSPDGTPAGSGDLKQLLNELDGADTGF